ncbi:hypothetical protein Bccel_1574 [Pseudobacteroides cellulosolvens ATCC 35603 = DSM 2933]|uniref:Uncharacterized protein n=1 Tax=Pseudobacteroides cellulosolvens ATCC 35603 = DSM 2933 TaxID=398512 RepID=A0A0L6JLQ1_9FIRM|nr:hypothetical protein Bccel_1574 [Pseudobacteroides cellulosolvens ATCC 35603 = DSM 2933]
MANQSIPPIPPIPPPEPKKTFVQIVLETFKKIFQ